jgi:anthraniloyl-CoA monooxygenase
MIRSGGHGFCGIARLKLLEIFQHRAIELGVKIVFERDIKDPDEYARDYDLVIGADGVNSVTRSRHEAHFNPRIDTRQCRFIWLGTRKKLDAFTFAFKETPWGWFNLHAYRFNDEMSTFIVETPESTWLKAGLDQLETPASIAFCENLFADLLDGHPLISNAKHLRGSAVWLKFNRVLCERWYRTISCCWEMRRTRHISPSARAPSRPWKTRLPWCACSTVPRAACPNAWRATRPSGRSRRSNCKVLRATA